MVRADDVLELLLPGADAAALRRAREVTQFLRLLCDDARRSNAPSVGLDLERARGVLEDHGRDALERALSDLVRHHLSAVQPPDSFAWAGEPELDAAQAWREVELARADFDGLPELPVPGETAADCGARVLGALAGLVAEPEGVLWRARWSQTTQGSRAAEPLFRELLSTARRPRPGVLVQRGAIAGVAECLLERGAVREARAWLGEHALQLSVDVRLRQLFAWTRLVLEDVAGARAALHGLRPWSGPLPQCLCDLREVQADWGTCLAGRADPAVSRAASASAGSANMFRANTWVAAALSNPPQRNNPAHPNPAQPNPAQRDRLVHASSYRAEWGASTFLVLAFHAGRGTEPIALDAAPALASRREAWLAEREGAVGGGVGAVACPRERQLVARAAAIVEHAAPGVALPGTLGGKSTRALAVVPILDDEGDAVGWIHAEFEHHLVPSSVRLAECASSWRRDALEARARTDSAAPETRRPPSATTVVFRDLVDELGLKTVQRRWTGYSVEGTEPILAAQGGDGQGFGELAPGRARGLARALATGGRIEFDEPDERLAVHARAGSGVVLPLRFDGRICGLLAVESSRRRDFQGVDLEAWSARADHAAIALRTAQFRAWHEQRFAFEPWFEPAREDFRAFARRVVRAAHLRGAVTITGAAGVGKLVIARWLHFESDRRAGPLVVHHGATPLASGDWSRLLERAAGGTLVLDDVDALDAASQEHCLAELEAGEDRGAHGARLFATTRVAAANSVARGAPATESNLGVLRADLALRLNRMRLHVPSLADRREEIPGLADALVRRFAAEEGTAAPQLADAAHALLWRQPWASNVRELENLVYQLVVEFPGGSVDAEDIQRVAAEGGTELARRIASRRPRREDLRMALRTTCTAGSRSNKTRAALYLGWDPDTLVVRLEDAGLTDQVVDIPAWSAAGDAPGGEVGGDPDVPASTGADPAEKPVGHAPAAPDPAFSVPSVPA